MKYFDLHCDTALSVWKNNESFYENSCHVSLKKAECFEKYIQLTAIFTPSALSDREGWEQFLAVYKKFICEIKENDVQIIKNRTDLEEFLKSSKKFAVILTIEDVRIIDGKTERIRDLYELGIRVITPLWASTSSIGGAHDTSDGLTKLGREALDEIIKCGIIPDISHASRKSASEIMDMCHTFGVSPIATHSNAYSVRTHSRNLTDHEYLRLTKLGGIAGISLCPYHLSSSETATAYDVIDHVFNYRKLCADCVSFGCDFDGTELPDDITGIENIPIFAEMFHEAGMSQKEIDSIFFDAAYNFFINNLPN